MIWMKLRMIHFDFNSADLSSIASLCLTVVLVLALIWLLFRTGARPSFRLAIRVSLHLMLWGGVFGYLLKPYLESPSKRSTGVLVAKNVPSTAVTGLTDSLLTAKVLDGEEKDLVIPDTLILFGQDFPDPLFAKIATAQYPPASISWIPLQLPGKIAELKWKGILRNGEMQHITGRLNEKLPGMLKLTYGNAVIDSVQYDDKTKDFSFSFPVFSLGRTEMALELNHIEVDTVRFFARPADPPSIRFELASPDFETRTLANWLGKKGFSVIYQSGLSTNMLSEVSINAAGKTDILVTDTKHLESVSKYLSEGKSVLVTNLSEPTADIGAINRYLGTSFRLEAEPSAAQQINRLWTSLPYKFVSGTNQFPIGALPVNSQQKKGTVVVSLFNETFPLILSGDSLSYGKIWGSVMASMHPPSQNAVRVQAPVFEGIGSEILFENFQVTPSSVIWGKDTVSLMRSAINPRISSGRLVPNRDGWVALTDSMEIYVGTKYGELYQAAAVAAFVKNFEAIRTELQRKTGQSARANRMERTTVPAWIWFLLIVCGLTGLWLEEKL